MKTLKKTLILLFIGLMSFSYAQDLNEAGSAFNDGNEAYKAKNYAAAVESYKSSLDMCQMIGGDAFELQTKVEAQLVNALYKNALTLYKKKKFDEAVEVLKETITAAETAGNTKIANKADAYIPKVYSSQGTSLIKEKKYDDAIVVFDKAIAYKEKCVNAYYGKGLAFKGKGDIDAAIGSFDKAIEYGEGNPKAVKTVNKTKSAGRKMLEANAAKELQIEHTQKAIDYLNKALVYGQGTSNTYFLLTLGYLKQNKADEAIKAAQEGIAANSGDSSDLNFQLGKAYELKGDKSNACAAYKKVVSGPNVDAAKYQLKEVLKCN